MQPLVGRAIRCETLHHSRAAKTMRAPPTPNGAWANIGACRRFLRLSHSPMVRTTLEAGRMFTVLPPNSFMIASSYSDNVFSGAFDLTCTIL